MVSVPMCRPKKLNLGRYSRTLEYRAGLRAAEPRGAHDVAVTLRRSGHVDARGPIFQTIAWKWRPFASAPAGRILEWASRHRESARAVISVGGEFVRKEVLPICVEDRLRISGNSQRSLFYQLRKIANRNETEAALRFDLDPATGTVSATVTGTVRLHQKTSFDDLPVSGLDKHIARDAMAVALPQQSAKI